MVHPPFSFVARGALLLRELSWRNSLRPLFALAGMESYSDQLEQMLKDTPKEIGKLMAKLREFLMQDDICDIWDEFLATYFLVTYRDI